MADTVNCPKCGNPNPSGADDCDNCGITFDIYATEKARAEAEEQARIESEAQEKARRESLVSCPKCGHPNDPLTADCLKCGIVFTKYYDSMKEDLADDPDKAGELAALEAAIARHEAMKVKRRKDLDAEAKRKEVEERRHLEELRKERERQEELRKEKEKQERKERERQEALKREQEEKERLERERLEKLRKEQEEKERQERARQEAIQREREEKERREREQQEALKREQEENARREQAQQEALRREQEEKARREQERQDALKREKEDAARQVALKREAEEKAKQAALQQEEAARQRSEEERAREEAHRMEILSQLVKPKGSLKKLLKTYVDEIIGMNYDNPTVVKEVKLASINDDYISVVAEEEGLVYAFPLTAMLSIIEGVDGVAVGSVKGQATFPLIIRVSHRTI